MKPPAEHSPSFSLRNGLWKAVRWKQSPNGEENAVVGTYRLQVCPSGGRWVGFLKDIEINPFASVTFDVSVEDNNPALVKMGLIDALIRHHVQMERALRQLEAL